MLDYLSIIETQRVCSPSMKYNSIFSEPSWLQVGSGINHYKPHIAKRTLSNEYPDFETTKFDIKNKLFTPLIAKLYNHTDYLNHLKNI